MLHVCDAMKTSAIAVSIIFLLFSSDCAGTGPKPGSPTVKQRTVISVVCAGEETADTVEQLVTGYDYRLVAGGRYPDKKLWFSGDRIAFEITGLDIGKRYIIELETPGYETMDMPQTVVVDRRLVASGWKGESLGVYLSKEALDDGRLWVMLISELQFSALGSFRLIENPVRYAREPKDMSQCPVFTEPTAADLIAEAITLAPATVAVDAGTKGRQLRRLWEGMMDMVPRMKELGTKHVRLWGLGLFADAYPSEGVYNWEHLDSVLQNIIGAGAKPVITLSSVPEWLWQTGASSEIIQAAGVPTRRIGEITPPHDLKKWATLIQDTVTHLNVHRGMGIQYLEVWDEPTAKVFWNGTLQQYLDLYEATATAAKRADPSIKVGGPAPAGLQPDWIRALLSFCKERNVPLDFISWHCFSRDPARYSKQAACVRKLAAEFGMQPELCLTTWNYAWGAREQERLSLPFAASYALASIKAMEEAGLNLAIYFASADWTGLGTYSGLVLSDIKTPKPVYNAFKMLSFLGNDRVKATSSAEKIGLDVLAARNDGEVSAIVWWWVPGTGEEKATCPVKLKFTGFAPAIRYRWETYSIDDTNANFMAGKDKEELTVAASGDVPEQANEFSIDIDVPLYGCRMVRMIPK